MYEDIDIGHDLKMAFMDGYEAGVEDTQQKWISVNEKQPPKAGWYQAFCEGHSHPEYLYFRGINGRQVLSTIGFYIGLMQCRCQRSD